VPAPPGNGGWDVRRVAQTGSTNADVAALARDGAPEGIVLVADHQTAGRGRLGRTWEAPPGASLLTTVLLRPRPADADLVLPAVATAMAAAVTECAGVDARIKWPNDLTVDDRKLAGVLAEAVWSGDDVAVCAGIGVNCNWPVDVPAELRETMTAINHVTGREVDRDALLTAFLDELGRRYRALDRVALLDEWRDRSATLGRRVRVDVGGEVVEGVADDITDDWHLRVGSRTFAVGDVTHLRHASPPR
jgi:BirA family transcriptional regulator, biotin operon repressor / biotin---[acetyl-CoA-carboxylase] ligase